jgi:hypothetical protein
LKQLTISVHGSDPDVLLVSSLDGHTHISTHPRVVQLPSLARSLPNAGKR